MYRDKRVRAPLMQAFRTAHAERDAMRREPTGAGTADRVVTSRSGAGRTGITEGELVRSVAHDIEGLMNTIQLAATLDLSAHLHAARSILNFGIPDVVHRSIEDIGVHDVGAEIRAALVAYEPRIVPDSIGVMRDLSADAGALKLRFVVSAVLDSEPLNIPVEFIADLERDTGKVTLGRK